MDLGGMGRKASFRLSLAAEQTRGLPRVATGMGKRCPTFGDLVVRKGLGQQGSLLPA